MHAFGPFTYVPVRCQKCMSGFSAFVLTTANILLRSMPNGNYLFNSASAALVGDKSLVHELRVMAGCGAIFKCNICPTRLALKPVYKKSQHVMGGKLFSVGQCLNYNHGHNILIIFHTLSNVWFTTSEGKRDH